MEVVGGSMSGWIAGRVEGMWTGGIRGEAGKALDRDAEGCSEGLEGLRNAGKDKLQMKSGGRCEDV